MPVKKLGRVILNELEHIGGSTTHIACVQVAPTQEGVEYIFVARGQFDHETPPSSPAVNYVRYRLPMGRLAEADPGKIATVTVDEFVGNNRSGNVFTSEYLVRCKDAFRVNNDAAQIDAIQNDISFPDSRLHIPSLREWLSRPAEETATVLAQPVRRLADRFELADIAVVDEATDFSAVELACMRLLAHPVFNCATFTGDLMQRMTSNGITSWNEIDDLVSPPPDKHDLKLSYRQSRKLLRIAAQLYEKALGHPAPFSAGYAENVNDPDALWYSAKSKEDQAKWIVKQIGELHRIWGEILRPIAVFVPDEADVSSTANLLRELLLETYGIETEACFEGRILGTQAKVRVFSVQFIKGLEFEAVFFLGADHMAAISPDLVDRFLYVGLTRARSFLALITDGEFPQALNHVRTLFKQGTWENLPPPSHVI